MKNRILLTILPIMASMLMSSISFAHAPETYTPNCTASNLNALFQNTDYCDPDNPPQIINGITHEEYPHGLCYPTFNNYTDTVWEKTCEDPDDLSTCQGLDPYGIKPPIFADERNFLQAKIEGEEPNPMKKNEYYRDELEVSDGDIIDVMMYLHNDGIPCFNDHLISKIPKNKSYSDWRTTAHNTKIKVSKPEVLTGEHTITALITADDALNASGKIGAAEDSIKLVKKGDEDLELKLITGTTRYVDSIETWQWMNHDIENPEQIFSQQGLPLSTLKDSSGDIKGSIGDYYASEPYIALVRFKFQATAIEKNICESLDAELSGKDTLTIGDEKAYKLFVKELKYTNNSDIPAETKIRWVTLDFDGRFYNAQGSVLTSPDEGFASIKTDPAEAIYYKGNGPLFVYTDGPDKETANSYVCKEILQVPVEIPPVCKELKVDHPEIIYEDTLSWFSANPLDTNNQNFGGTITYSVDSGHGLFYTTPVDADWNPSTIVNETGAHIPWWQYIPLNENLTVVDFSTYLDLVETDKISPVRKSIITDFAYSISDQSIWNVNFYDEKATQENRGSKGSFARFGQTSLFGIEPLISENIQLLNPSFFETITTTPNTKVYFFATKPGNNVIHVKSVGTPDDTCERDFSITAQPDIPEEEMQCNAAELLVVDTKKNYKTCLDKEDGKLSLQMSFYENADKTQKIDPSKVRVMWSSTDKKSTFDYIESDLLTAIDHQFIGGVQTFYQGGGTIKAKLVQLDGKDSFNSICQAEISECEEPPPEEELLCTDLDDRVRDYSSDTPVSKLEKNEIYSVISKGDYTLDNPDGTVDYEMDLQYGAIFHNGPSDPSVDVPPAMVLVQEALEDTLLADLEARQAMNKLTPAYLTDFFSLGVLHSSVTVKDNTKIYLITYGDTSQSKAGIFKIGATGFDNCASAYDIDITPPPGGFECTDLDITKPDSNWNTENDNTQSFQLSVQTTPSGHASDLYYHWVVENSNAEWANGNDYDITSGQTTNFLEGFEGDKPYVTVYASYDIEGTQLAESCSDTVVGDYSTGGNNGGNHGGNSDKKASIIKKAFVENDVTHPAKTINISGGDHDTIKGSEYVTFISTYTMKDEEEVDITEEKLKIINNVSGRIKGNLGGYLDFKGMRINILASGSGQDYFIMETNDYKPDSEDKGITKDYDFNSCGDDDKNKVCIDENKEESAKNTFKKGLPLRFKNIKKNYKIQIKLQMNNKTVINNSRCKTLTTEKGCGEEFINKISFDNDDHEDGSSTSKVIAICPYILSRASGDVFFHKALDTGIDTAKCSPVKNTTGQVIIPENEVPQEHINTGTGTGNLEDLGDTVLLSLPSHDICRYSNMEGNLKGYNNVLKNFSSTICEMRAKVSAEWKEGNINNAIKANIQRIARWGENLNVPNLYTIDNLSFTNNNQSGVFVTNSNLTIGGGIPYIIESTDQIPATQTYIIKDADLYINNDIIYGYTDYTKKSSDIPSVAFIVINGDIHISNKVTHLDGVYMAVDMDINGNKGKVIADGGQTQNLLTINGSLFGDVNDLFSNRIGVGDPIKNEGSVTIRYDERILLNTPPGLGELINIAQTIVPN